MEFLRNLLECSSEKVIVFTFHRAVWERVKADLLKQKVRHVGILGGMTGQEKMVRGCPESEMFYKKCNTLSSWYLCECNTMCCSEIEV